MSYVALKMIHVSAVTLSFFASRLEVSASTLVHHVCGIASHARTLPHVVDVVLLLSALAMLWAVRLSPWAVPWLRAKIVGLSSISFSASLPCSLRHPRKPADLRASGSLPRSALSRRSVISCPSR